MNVYNQTDEELEQRIKDHKPKMRRMLLVFVVVMFLNVLFVLGVAKHGPPNSFIELFVSIPLCVINCLSVYWLGLGGRWKRLLP